MYQEIKDLAEKALALQNKDAMDKALRDIWDISYMELSKTMFSRMRDAATEAEAPAFNADSIALEELASGRTMLLNGRYVKLIDGDLEIAASTPKAKRGAK